MSESRQSLEARLEAAEEADEVPDDTHLVVLLDRSQAIGDRRAVRESGQAAEERAELHFLLVALCCDAYSDKLVHESIHWCSEGRRCHLTRRYRTAIDQLRDEVLPEVLAADLDANLIHSDLLGEGNVLGCEESIEEGLVASDCILLESIQQSPYAGRCRLKFVRNVEVRLLDMDPSCSYEGTEDEVVQPRTGQRAPRLSQHLVQEIVDDVIGGHRSIRSFGNIVIGSTVAFNHERIGAHVSEEEAHGHGCARESRAGEPQEVATGADVLGASTGRGLGLSAPTSRRPARTSFQSRARTPPIGACRSELPADREGCAVSRGRQRHGPAADRVARGDVSDMEYFISHALIALPVLGVSVLRAVTTAQVAGEVEATPGVEDQLTRFVLRNRAEGRAAYAIEREGEFTVLAGSHVRARHTGSGSYWALRARLEKDGTIDTSAEPAVMTKN